ncbi:hypothetical protein F5X98DRAFT_52554 [Xylaria grammica]|nr:hypothetical protein F5X98DRAFT_52554 [Xylaria grammica]
MHFPLEIIDHIIGYLVEPEPVKELGVWWRERAWRNRGFKTWGCIVDRKTRKIELWDQFISCDYNPQPYEAEENGDRAGRCFTYPSLQHLYCLRLVSRIWNASASRILRRYKWWSVDIDRVGSLEEALQLFVRKSDSVDFTSKNHLFSRLTFPIIRHVRSFIRDYYIDTARRDGKDRHSIYTETSDASGMCTTRGAEEAERDYRDRSVANRLLRDLIYNLTHVESFCFAFEDAESSTDCVESFVAGCYDVALFDMTMDTLLFGLRSPAFQHLVDLRLALPGTHDVGRLAVGIPENVKQQLKHLYLEIVDCTGPGGSDEYVHDQGIFLEGIEDPFYDGTQTNIEESASLPSNMQIQYPNRDHQHEVWAFIEACNNLESLSLFCTHYLSLDRLNWTPGPNFRGLRALSLGRVYANASTLIELLAARGHGETDDVAARRVHFEDVKIYRDGGEWATVFSWLAEACPRLEFFRVWDVGYFSTHPYFSPPVLIGGTQEIWTESRMDFERLQALLHDLVRKAGGASQYPGYICYEKDNDDDW